MKVFVSAPVRAVEMEQERISGAINLCSEQFVTLTFRSRARLEAKHAVPQQAGAGCISVNRTWKLPEASTTIQTAVSVASPRTTP
jgi:hypothetical protein